MTNLLKETEEVLKSYNLSWDDVSWVGGDDFSIPLEDVPRVFDVDYDEGFGAAEIAIDLKIVGDNWWLERREYDGSEWWALVTMPLKPLKEEKIFKVKGGFGNWFLTLKGMNFGEDRLPSIEGDDDACWED